MASYLDVRRGLCVAAALVLPTLLAACDTPPNPDRFMPPAEEGSNPADVIPVNGDSSCGDADTDAGPASMPCPPPVNPPPVNPQLQIMKPGLPGG